VACPDLPDRHQAIVSAAWAPYAAVLGHREGEALSAFVARVKAAVDPNDPDVPAVVREAVRAVIGLCSASAMSRATGVDLLALVGDQLRN
jgi:hypothetical protein